MLIDQTTRFGLAALTKVVAVAAICTPILIQVRPGLAHHSDSAALLTGSEVRLEALLRDPALMLARAHGVIHSAWARATSTAGQPTTGEPTSNTCSDDCTPSVSTMSIVQPAPEAAAEAMRVAALSPSRALSREEANVARFLAGRYRVAADLISDVVQHAFDAARKLSVDPHLVLAVISVESSFDPLAQSDKGAQGLMQVLTRLHREKFAEFGGAAAAFDPFANIAVGTQILRDYLTRDGTEARALKAYVGAALLPGDGGYGSKVLSERARIAAAAAGRAIAPDPAGKSLEPAPKSNDLTAKAEASLKSLPQPTGPNEPALQGRGGAPERVRDEPTVVAPAARMLSGGFSSARVIAADDVVNLGVTTR